MASGKAFLGRVLGPLLFTPAKVVSVRTLTEHFRSIVVEGDTLRKAEWLPGDKLRVFLRAVGLRTYTPISWDATHGRAEIVAYVRPQNGTPAPGADWARTVEIGTDCQLFGPQRSLRVDRETPVVVLFGDETSFGVARALRTVSNARPVFEVNDPVEARAVLAGLGIDDAVLITRAGFDTHLDSAARALRDALDAEPTAPLFLTGRAQSIQAIQSYFKANGRVPPSRTKAYWSVGKAGLD
jgi:NADPH-dependent ferric siderophore reductase